METTRMAIAPDANMPVQKPKPTLNGLLDVAITPEEAPERWEGGFTWIPESCEPARSWNPCTPHNGDRYDRTKESQEEFSDADTYQPFVVYAPVSCSSVGFETADYDDRARRALEARASAAIEAEFWSGSSVTDNPHLHTTPYDDDHVVNPGGASATEAVSPAQALILLSNALGSCLGGQRGVIHATVGLVEEWLHQALLSVDEDGRLVTGARGDYVVAGSGYDGSGPHGSPSTDGTRTWAYATGMVYALVGEVEVFPKTLAEALDRATNTVEFRAEQTAAVWHDGCCQFAVLVSTASTQVCCDPIDGTLQGGIFARWEEDGTSIGFPGPILKVYPTGNEGGEWTPAADAGTVGGFFAYGDGSDPSTEAIPTHGWEPVIEAPAPPYGLFLPISLLPAFGIPYNEPVWLRQTFTSSTGCSYSHYYYIQSGIPDDWEEDVVAWVSLDGGLSWGNTDTSATFTIPGGSETPVEIPLEALPEGCPEQPCATPVMIPECFLPLPVDATVTAEVGDINVSVGVDPVDCGGGDMALPVAIRCPDPVPVVLDEASAVELSVQGNQLSGAAGATVNDTVPAGARVVVFRFYGGKLQDYSGGTVAKDDTVAAIQQGTGNLTMSPSDPPLTLEAPAGSVFPAIPVSLIINGSQTEGASFSWLAYF